MQIGTTGSWKTMKLKYISLRVVDKIEWFIYRHSNLAKNKIQPFGIEGIKK